MPYKGRLLPRYETVVKGIPYSSLAAAPFQYFLQRIGILETLVMISYSCARLYGPVIQLPPRISRNWDVFDAFYDV